MSSPVPVFETGPEAFDVLSDGRDELRHLSESLRLHYVPAQGGGFLRVNDGTELILTAVEPVGFNWKNRHGLDEKSVLEPGESGKIRRLDSIFTPDCTIALIAIGQTEYEKGSNLKWPEYDLTTQAGNFVLSSVDIEPVD